MSKAKKTTEHLLRVTLVLFMAQSLVLLYWIWNALNPYQMDHMGHLASGVSTLRGLYHKHQDAFFLGGIHGLFYPPLEDFLLSFWLWVSRSPDLAYQLHLSLLAIGTTAGWTWLLGVFKTLPSRAGAALVLSALLWAGKLELLDFQGLSWIDLMITGLTSQMLGGVFLALLLRELLTHQRPASVALWVSLSVLAHLVVGVVAGALTFCLLFLPKTHRRFSTKAYVIALVCALLATAFFWLPFIWHRSELVPSMILRRESPLFVIVGLATIALCLGLGFLRNLAILTTFLLGVNTAVNTLQAQGLSLPHFHYYRFSIFGLFLGTILMFLIYEKTKTRRTITRLALTLLLAQWCYGIFSTFSFPLPTLTPQSANADFSEVSNDPQGRTWILGPHRSIDFSLDSRLWIERPEMRFVKGLFWESASSNTWLNSYFATLLSPPVVLDFFYFYNYPCHVQRCLLDHFFAQAGVTSWIAPEDFALPYLSQSQSACYRQTVGAAGTSQFTLTRVGSLAFGGKKLTQWRVEPRSHSLLSSQWIERLQTHQIDSFRSGLRRDELALRQIHAACEKSQTGALAWVSAQDLAQIRALPLMASKSGHSTGEPSFIKKIAQGKYSLWLPGEPDLFRIKLAPLPGATLRDENGKRLPLWSGYPHLIGYGSGKMTLTFEEPKSVQWGNRISLLSLLLIAGVLAFLRSDQKPKPKRI